MDPNVIMQSLTPEQRKQLMQEWSKSEEKVQKQDAPVSNKKKQSEQVSTPQSSKQPAKSTPKSGMADRPGMSQRQYTKMKAAEEAAEKAAKATQDIEDKSIEISNAIMKDFNESGAGAGTTSNVGAGAGSGVGGSVPNLKVTTSAKEQKQPRKERRHDAAKEVITAAQAIVPGTKTKELSPARVKWIKKYGEPYYKAYAERKESFFTAGQTHPDDFQLKSPPSSFDSSPKDNFNFQKAQYINDVLGTGKVGTNISYYYSKRHYGVFIFLGTDLEYKLTSMYPHLGTQACTAIYTIVDVLQWNVSSTACDNDIISMVNDVKMLFGGNVANTFATHMSRDPIKANKYLISVMVTKRFEEDTSYVCEAFAGAAATKFSHMYDDEEPDVAQKTDISTDVVTAAKVAGLKKAADGPDSDDDEKSDY